MFTNSQPLIKLLLERGSAIGIAPKEDLLRTLYKKLGYVFAVYVAPGRPDSARDNGDYIEDVDVFVLITTACA